MTSLTDRIRRAQIQAGEEAVLADLRKRGLLDPTTPASPNKDAEIARLRAGLNIIAQAGAVHGGAWCVAQALGHLHDLDFDQFPETGRHPE